MGGAGFSEAGLNQWKSEAHLGQEALTIVPVRPHPLYVQQHEEGGEAIKEGAVAEEATAEKECTQEEGARDMSEENLQSEGNEARQPKCVRSPYEPTAKERAVHEKYHLPYRSWCKW